MRRLEGHTHDVMAVAFAPDGRRLASAGWDGTVRVWDLASGRCERAIRTAHEHAFDVAFSPDGNFLAAGFRHDGAPELFTSGYGTVGWFSAEADPNKSPDWISPGDTWYAHRPGTRSVSFTPDGKHLLTCGTDVFENALLVWDLAERDILTRIPRNFYPFQVARFRPDGGAVAAACSDSGEGVFVWHRAAGHSFRVKPHVLRFAGDRCWGLAWSPDGESLAAVFDSGRIAWWAPGTESTTIRAGHRGAGCAAAYSPDGRLLLTAGKEGLIHLWDNSTHSRRITFDWRIGDVHGVAFAPDGLTAAAAGNETVLLWDIDA